MTAPKLPPFEPARRAAQQLYPVDFAADFRRTWHVLVERAWIVTLCLVVFLAAGGVYLRRAPVLYSSTATIQVEQPQQQIFRADNVPYENLQALDFLQTVAQSLKARPLLEGVAETNQLAQNPLFASWTNDPGAEDITKALDKMVTVRLRRGTRLIDITAVHRQPGLAATIANSLVSQYIADNAQRHVTSTGVANELLLKEAERLKKKLQESEHVLQTYKEQSKASSLDDRQNTVVAELRELSTKATEAKALRIKAEADNNQVVELGTNVEALLTVPSVATDQTVVSARINLAKAEDEFAALKQRYKEKHPKYIQARSQIQALQNEVGNSALKASQRLKATLDGCRAAEEALDAALKSQEASALELGRLAIQYGVLSREVESDRALYDSVLSRMKETSVTKEMQPTSIRVVQRAYPPLKPFSPKKTMIVALSGLAGLFLGLLIVLSLSFLDTSIKTVDEAEALVHQPVLATIPQLKEARKQALVMEEPRCPGAEGFRTLRAGLSMLGREEDRRVFLFTSSVPMEGKTFSSINYAASLAQLGLKTILIDADLRRPTVEIALKGSEAKDSEASSPGVTDYLTGQKTFQEVVQTTKLAKLSLISSGTTAPNPAELLANDGLSGLIEEALRHYDRVVLDSTPIHAVSDTLLMLQNVQTVCLVIRAARTSNRYVLRCVQLLQAAEAPLAGIVLNRMPVRRGLGNGHYYQSPYYDYAYHGKYARKGVYSAR